MSIDPDAVVVGAVGRIYRAPLGTTAPTTAVATWNVAYVDLGAVSEDGVEHNIDEDMTELKAWGGTVLRTVRTSQSVTFGFTLLESKLEVVEAYYGTEITPAVDPATGGRIAIGPGRPTPEAWGIDVIDGDTHHRFVIPKGSITSREPVPYKADEIAAYGITLTAFAGSDEIAAYLFSDSVAWEAA